MALLHSCTIPQIDPALKVCSEQAGDIAMDVRPGNCSTIFGEQAVCVGENGRHRTTGILPFIDDLLEDPGVRVLRDKTHAEHFDALTSNFLNDGRLIQKPPGSERKKVAEFSRVNTEFMLIFAAKNADEKPVLRKLHTEMLNCSQVGLAHPVSGEFDSGVYLVANPDHDG